MVTGVVQFGLGALLIVVVVALLPKLIARFQSRLLDGESEG